MKLFFNYYKTVTLINLCFCLCAAILTLNVIWFPFLFCTLGIAVSMLGYNFFFKDQYYFYHNMGYTKKKLALMTFGINLLPAAILLFLVLILS